MSLILDGTAGLSDIDGSASTPAIRGTDANTGIYFPGADRIGFAEGGTQVGEFDASGNFLFNSGYGSVATAYGCRAWINFNGTSTPAIRSSGNFTSITDHGTGDYTLNFTNAMPDVNYAVSGAVGSSTTVLGNIWQNTTRATQATGSVAISTANYAGSFTDMTYVFVAIFR